MTRGPDWTPADYDKLLRLRDGEGLSWSAVCDEFPHRTEAALKLVYYTRLRDRNAVKNQPRRPGPSRSRDSVAPAPIGVEEKLRRLEVIRQASLAFAQRQASRPVKPATVVRPAPPARNSVAVSTSLLIVDAELRSRIAVLGITGGLQGDPEPGRSALDKRDIVEPVAPPTQGVRSPPRVTLATAPLKLLEGGQ